MGWTPTNRVLNPGRGKRLISCPKRPDPSSFLYNGYRGLFWEVKRPGCESSDSPPSSTDVENEWLYLHSNIRLRGVHCVSFTFNCNSF